MHSAQELNTEFRSAYTLGAVIGSGQFGTVVKVKRNKDDAEFVAKLIRVARCPAWCVRGTLFVYVLFLCCAFCRNSFSVCSHHLIVYITI